MLLAAFEGAEPGSEYVVPSLRSRSNLRTAFVRLAAQAGVTMCPKPFQNMRASCATDLCTRFPGHVAAEWLGHTEAIAEIHHRQVTNDHYRAAAAGEVTALEKAMHNPMQQSPAIARTGTQAKVESMIFLSDASRR